MTITPTDKGAIVAGAGFWCLIWAVASKLDAIPVINRFVNSKAVFSWVRKNKTLTLLISELVNVSAHGVANPSTTLFVLGGTLMNTFVIFILLPVSGLFNGNRSGRVIS